MSKSNKKHIRAENAKKALAALPDKSPKFQVKAGSLQPKIEPLFERKKSEAPVVWYSNRAWQKMKQAISICPEEVGWLGTVDKVDGGYMVTDIHVPEQIVTGAETDISADALAQLVVDLDYPENLYYWGHSHVNMGVSPSGQDEQQTAEYLEHNDVFIRGIYNKRGDSKVDVFDMVEGMLYQAVKNGVKIEPLAEDEMEAFTAIVKTNVKKRVYNNSNHNTGGANNSYREQYTGGSKAGKSGGASTDEVKFRTRYGGDSSIRANYENPFIVKEDL